MIKVFNIRNGFANNSSSTHSIIFSDQPVNVVDDYSYGDFGWDFFTVATKQGILDYLGASLHSNISYKMNEQYVEAIVDSWVGPMNWDDMDEYSSVDHQSLLTFPITFDRSGINKQYFDEFKNLLLSNNAMILGGNDNDDHEHRLKSLGKQADFDYITENSGLIAKKDEKNNYWTFFNERTGDKIRLVLDTAGNRTIMPTKASTPDLVDVKITDYCTTGCQFCYQGSTKAGRHADFDDIEKVIDELSENQVFEIAFGGGETTSHPNFIEILKYTAENHIKPNFTTKDFNWLKENIGDIHEIIGSCAYSVSNVYDIKKISTIIDFYELPNNKICVQYVMGSSNMYQYKAIVDACIEYRVPLTLLGFKTIGRGETYKQNDHTGWLDYLLQQKGFGKWFTIGIDTALVQQSEQILADAGMPNWLYHKDEGVFSWYIDAVAKQMGSSSYYALTPYQNIRKDFIDQYSKFGDEFQKTIDK